MVSSIMSSVKGRAKRRDWQTSWRRQNPDAAKQRSSSSNRLRSLECVASGLTQRKLVESKRLSRKPIVNAAEYKRNRYHDDIRFQLRVKLSNRLYEALVRVGATKDCSTSQLLGCSLTDFKSKMLASADGDMNGKHIDHIFPISMYQLPEESFKAMHWSNLRMVSGRINQQKGASLPAQSVALRVHRDRWPDGITEADLC
jgi:5-methylcytosine-specific restriction endonuclease McrA